MEKPAYKIHNHARILFTCIGRRVSLLESFRSAARGLGITTRIIGTDSSPLSAALQLCDAKYVVSPVRHTDYLSQILEIVKREQVNLLVPTTDLDLWILAETGRALIMWAAVFWSHDLRSSRYARTSEKLLRFCLSMASIRRTQSRQPKPCPDRRFDTHASSPWDGHASRGTAKVENLSWR